MSSIVYYNLDNLKEDELFPRPGKPTVTVNLKKGSLVFNKHCPTHCSTIAENQKVEFAAKENVFDKFFVVMSQRTTALALKRLNSYPGELVIMNPTLCKVIQKHFGLTRNSFILQIGLKETLDTVTAFPMTLFSKIKVKKEKNTDAGV